MRNSILFVLVLISIHPTVYAEQLNFYPIGFSKDGWFAYAKSPSGDISDSTNSYCPQPPCRDTVTILNLDCTQSACLSDSPQSKSDKCWCPIGARIGNLKEFGIARYDSVRIQKMPVMVNGKTYGITTVFNEAMYPSENLHDNAKHPGTEVFLTTESGRKKLIRSFMHDHEGVKNKTVKAAGWIKDPFHPRVVILLSYIDQDTQKARVVPAGFYLSPL